ncbi:hypothetical protein T4C_12186 [Trichinella pseudospiralis]|nr:hypothetical protein T4C_12186 [Trichinella pseudospiralis]
MCQALLPATCLFSNLGHYETNSRRNAKSNKMYKHQQQNAAHNHTSINRWCSPWDMWPYDGTDQVLDVDSRNANCSIPSVPVTNQKAMYCDCSSWTLTVSLYFCVVQRMWSRVDSRYQRSLSDDFWHHLRASHINSTKISL